ncbi:pre-mRNA-processing protein 45 [Zopfia rhizophila CBS 207.26]|uniref:Pre-mRNA-processing protein 45 n=1 Tax=Zopfia rhizophila CBS 207.26 TaxID=1314779 RepID=A0A6A6EVC4_9PEZI|nr:pre-mRNA-processing protein 45 [Zopfia rhizophila CBS 207.26]
MSVTSLSKALPKPKYTGEEAGEEEEIKQSRGARVVTADQIDNSLVLKSSKPPPYGQRLRWRPRSAEDFADGGAYPECNVAQYPLDMGRTGTASTSNALTLKVDSEGKTKYDEIARRGHTDSRIVQASFKDLIPLRQRADAGELDLERPNQELVEAAKERTAAALQALVAGQTAAQRPKMVKGRSNVEPTFVRYTPTAQMGEAQSKTRILKIQQRQIDPLEPPKFKHKRIPRGPPSPPPPVLHSPPRKLTAQDQENWKIPPPISNWKNPKGYTVPLDKRLAADGRGLQDVTINDKFAQFSEALFTADRHAREEVKQRALMQQKLAEKEKLQREEHLRQLAQKAREERTQTSRRKSDSRRSRSSSYSSGSESEDKAARQREEMRKERRREHERELRQSRMGTERKMQMLAREQNRDISEKVALGLAKPTQSGEAMYDSRLFNQTSGFDTGFNEDQHYDKPLFAAQDAISSIYRPNVQQDDDEDGGETYDKITKTSRFEVLGKAKEGFKGAAEAEARDGPVQFEKDTDDPFNINEMISEVTGTKVGSKRYGIQDPEERSSKKARVEEDD